MHGQHHFLQAVGVAVRGGWGGFRGVLGHVAGSLAGVLYQADVDDVAIAGRDVPFAAKVLLVEVRRVTQDMQVRVPVRGFHRPFDFNARAATLDAVMPPASPPEPPKSSVKTIQSMGERLIISGKGEGDEAGW